MAGLLGIVVLAAADSAYAQAPTRAQIAAARRAFAEGVEAANGQRWADALAAFERAYEIAPRPQILLNLAGAQVQTGHLVDGIASYRRFLREAPVALIEAHGEDVRDALARAEARVGRVRFRARGVRPSDVLLLDDRELSGAERTEPVEVDPGRHRLAVQRDGRHVVGVDFRVNERERSTVVVEVPEEEGARRPERRRRRSSGSVLESPWLWIAVGAVAVGTAVVIGVAASGGEEPFVGSFPPGRAEVR